MNKADGKFVDAGGIKTHYYEKGVGTPLVLFHGGAFGHPTAADSAWDWSTNFDALAAVSYTHLTLPTVLLV